MESRESRYVPYLLLTALCLALYLPGSLSLPPVDRDEARFAQATKQMLESGDFVAPRFRDEGRFRKPIGIYWLQAAAVALCGGPARSSITAYRLPSLCGAVIAVWLLFVLGRELFGASAGLLGAATLASSALLVAEASLATTDAVLLAAVVAAQASLGRIYLAAQKGIRPSAWVAAGFWVAQAIGILVKGPVLPAASALTIAALCWADRRRRLFAHAWLADLRPAAGLPILLVALAPWAIAVGLATHGDFYRGLRDDILPKLRSVQESHGGPPGTYALTALATLWPGSLLVVPGLVAGWRRRSSPAERFCLAWLAPTWIALELLPTKLPHYVLPVVPALALLAGSQASSPEPRGILSQVTFGLWVLVGLAVGAAALALPLLLEGRLPMPAWIAAASAIGMTAVVARRWRTGRLDQALRIAVAGAPLVFAPWLGGLLPGLDSLWLSRSIADRAAGVGAGSVAVVGYQEPSLVFLLGSRVDLAGPDGAAELLQKGDVALVLVTEAERGAFETAARARGVRLRRADPIDGINYSKGRRVRIELFAKSPG